jgi:uncharacterized surface protein with fasciclin (FAS1) repeats
MLQRSKLSSKLLIGLASLGFIGAIATYSTPGQAQTSSPSQAPSYAPRANDDSMTRMGSEPSATERTPAANFTSPERSMEYSSATDNQASRSDAQISVEAVNNTQPGGNERESAARTPLTDPGEVNNGTIGGSIDQSGSMDKGSTGATTQPTDASPVTDTQPGGNERESAPRTPEVDPGEASATERTPAASQTSPEQAGSMGNSTNSGSSVETNTPSTERAPVTNTQPGGSERPTSPRTPLTDPGEVNNGSGVAPSGQSMNDRSQSFEQALDGNADFSTLASVIKASGLDTTLASGGPYTVFAPTNEAFASILPETLRQLMLPANRQVLRQILTYHVVAANLPSGSIKPGSVNTVEGSPVAIADDAGSVTVSGANVVQPDIVTRNGVIHAIDQVLLPPSLQQ